MADGPSAGRRTRHRVRLRLVHPRSGTMLADRLEAARSFYARTKGLIGRECLEAGEGLWIVPCNGIHMFFMSFAVDALFLDRSQRVVKLRRRLGRWRVVPIVFGANSVVELPAGACDGLELPRGEQLRIEGIS